MTYDPCEYWLNHPPLERYPAHDAQEEALLHALDGSMPSSVLEVGVGGGRIGKLLMERWPDATYTGLDISPARLDEARRNLPERAELIEADLMERYPIRSFDLVVAVEVLMHIPPDHLRDVILKLTTWSQHLVTVDWTEPVAGPIAEWNFRHDYEAYGLTPVKRIGLQTIHHAST